LTALWYVLLFLLAAIGAYAKGLDLGRVPWLWPVLMCLAFTVVHGVYWSDLRMRAPLMPAVCLLAALGARSVVRWRGAPKRLISKDL
jgi:hypothetical protein